MAKAKAPVPFGTIIWSAGQDGMTVHASTRSGFPYSDEHLRRMGFHATADSAIETMRTVKHDSVDTLCDHLRILHGVDV